MLAQIRVGSDDVFAHQAIRVFASCPWLCKHMCTHVHTCVNTPRFNTDSFGDVAWHTCVCTCASTDDVGMYLKPFHSFMSLLFTDFLMKMAPSEQTEGSTTSMGSDWDQTANHRDSDMEAGIRLRNVSIISQSQTHSPSYSNKVNWQNLANPFPANSLLIRKPGYFLPAASILECTLCFNVYNTGSHSSSFVLNTMSLRFVFIESFIIRHVNITGYWWACGVQKTRKKAQYRKLNEGSSSIVCPLSHAE